MLGGYEEGEVWEVIAYAYGRNLWIALQVGSLTLCCSFPFFFLFPPFLIIVFSADR